MKRLIQFVVAVSLMHLSGTSLKAQPRYEDRGDERYHRFGREILDRIRGDLSRAERDLHYIAEPDLRRFQNTQANLGDFQRKWEHGRYDRVDLDRAIGGLNALVDRGHLRPRDRDMLGDDLRRLRDLQDRIERRR